MSHRIAILGIYHESNTFLNHPTTLEDFQRCYLLRGAELINEYRDAYHEIGGMIEVLEASAARDRAAVFRPGNTGRCGNGRCL